MLTFIQFTLIFLLVPLSQTFAGAVSGLAGVYELAYTDCTIRVEGNRAPSESEVDITLPSICGNALVEESEECDDGDANYLAGGLCKKDCTLDL